MRKTKFAVCALIAVMIAAVALIGCGGKNETKPDASEPVPEYTDIRDGSWDGLGSLATSQTAPGLAATVDSATFADMERNLISYMSTANNLVWYSGGSADSFGEHSIVLDLGKAFKVHKVAITPYLFTEDNGTIRDELGCFPKNIAVEYSLNPGKQTRVLDYQNYEPQYEVKGSGSGKYATDLEFGLESYVTARYIRFVFTGMTPDGGGQFYYAKICRVKAYVTKADEIEEAEREYEELLMPDPYDDFSYTPSSTNTKWGFLAKNLHDGNTATQWCAEWQNSESAATDEYVDIASRDGSVVKFTSLTMYGADNNKNMADGFGFEYSIGDGGFASTKYVYVSYVNPKGKDVTVHEFMFDEPIIADTLRIHFNSRTPNEEGNYALILGEVDCTAVLAYDDEIEAAKTEYTAALGNLNKKSKPENDKGALIALVTASAIFTALGVVLFFVPLPRKAKKEETI